MAVADTYKRLSAEASWSTGGNLRTGIVKTTLAGFTPGNIISDVVFTNKNSMSEAQIQSFFDSKVSRCLGGTDEDGRPIVCLKDFKTTSVNRSADQYCQGYVGALNESAARVIHRVAQSCGINPQVLVVMLQKEQGLVTHSWPSAWRFDKALGQGCPDGGVPCDPKFVGFFHQIYGAARQMQIYMEGRYFTWFAPGKTWDILFHPAEYLSGAWVNRCGSAPVYIANKATSALYYYTPYQPNAAALAAGHGEGDSCSAYGNRNFYNYFTDWFGSTHPPALQPINTSQHVVSVNAAGNLLAYPFGKNAWGDPVQIGAGFGGANVFGSGDLNGDGNRDIIASKADGSLLFVSGTGTGYGAVWRLRASWASSVLQAAAGDFDGDRIPDMFTTTKTGALLLWRGDHTGELREGVQVGSGWGVMNLIVGGTDQTGDGHTDLIARDSSGNLWLYPGTGTGGFGGRISLGSGWNVMATVSVPGDFDGDGRADVLASDRGGAMWLYRGITGGTVTNGPLIGSGWNAMSSVSGPGAKAGQPRPFLPGAGDVDSDGDADVVASTPDGRLAVYDGNGQGGWGGAGYVRTDWQGQKKMIPLGDFDGNGTRDLGSVDTGGRFLLWSGDGNGGFASPKQIGSGWNPDALFIGGLDFDGDRRTDVLTRAANGDLLMYRGNGAGGWATGSAQWIGSGWGSVDTALYAGDFDRDGRGDILARRPSDGTLWLYPTETGYWGTPRQIGSGWNTVGQVISPGDFSGDGSPDLLARRADGTLVLYRGDGRGGWGAVSVIGSGWSAFALFG